MTATWNNGTTVYDETVGAMQTYFVYPSNSHQIFSAADDGDSAAILLASVICEAVSRIENAPEYFPFSCICCPRLIRRLDAVGLFFIALPDDPQRPPHLGRHMYGMRSGSFYRHRDDRCRQPQRLAGH